MPEFSSQPPPQLVSEPFQPDAESRRGRSARATLAILSGLHLPPMVAAVCWGWQAGLGTLAALHAVLLATTLNVHSRLFGSARRTVPLEGKSVCLTIDDGPCEDTEEILELLDAHGAKAVFFLIGQRAAARPDDVREILRRGHRIGNHTQTHPAGKFWIYGPWSQRREIRDCQETFARLTVGHPPRESGKPNSRTSASASASETGPNTAATNQPTGLFRAPAGFRNPFTAPVLHESGLEAWGWHARGFDASSKDIPIILRRLTTGLKPGAILLIHQGQAHHREVLRRLLEHLALYNWSCQLPGN